MRAYAVYSVEFDKQIIGAHSNRRHCVLRVGLLVGVNVGTMEGLADGGVEGTLDGKDVGVVLGVDVVGNSVGL